MYSSPITPCGTTSSPCPNTYTLVLDIAVPIGMLRAPSSTSGIWYVQVNVVPSVGPYPFINLVPHSSSFAFLICLTDNASPPTSNCFNPPSAPTPSSTIALNRLEVSHIVVTPSSTIAVDSFSTVGTLSSKITSLPPVSRGPHISNVDASNVADEPCSTTSSSPNSA